MQTSQANQMNISQEQFSGIEKSVANISQLNKILQEKTQKVENITFFVQIILASSVILNVSDIHFEPEEDKVKIRLRLDGILHNVILLEKPLYSKILSRVKLISGLKLNIANKSQDGRFTFGIASQAKNQEIETRVSILPSEYGETLVMRVLNPKALLDIEDLGIRDDLREMFEKEIARPNGMIVVTGPTGSGKTTTLYAVLKKIQNSEIKIITLEDPIEYHLEGISQSQVHPESGYDFASGLQAIVRQDPDVILVGEIRDFQTGQMALQASLTGHLVLSTLHTNDAAGTIARFQALGIKPNETAPALNLIVAQRLVRVVCLSCKKNVLATPQEKQEIAKEVSLLPDRIKDQLKLNLDSLKIAKAQGCEQCNNSGFKGRAGIYEFMAIDDELENFIMTAPSTADLAKKAREKGMTTMKQDGVIKVIQGITTLEEVQKAVGG